MSYTTAILLGIYIGVILLVVRWRWPTGEEVALLLWPLSAVCIVLVILLGLVLTGWEKLIAAVSGMKENKHG
jgi:hypothetical protein